MDQGEGGNMFTQRVKAVWLCLVCMDLMFSPSIDNKIPTKLVYYLWSEPGRPL